MLVDKGTGREGKGYKWPLHSTVHNVKKQEKTNHLSGEQTQTHLLAHPYIYPPISLYTLADHPAYKPTKHFGQQLLVAIICAVKTNFI